MKDQDFYGAKNDYMAEAFVRVSDASSAQAGGYPKQIHLMLNRPKNAGKARFLPCSNIIALYAHSSHIFLLQIAIYSKL